MKQSQALEKEYCKEAQRIFDLANTDCCQCKIARRKVAEAMRRIRGWFNKELKTEEPIPTEFRELFKNKDEERIRTLWNRFL